MFRPKAGAASDDSEVDSDEDDPVQHSQTVSQDSGLESDMEGNQSARVDQSDDEEVAMETETVNTPKKHKRINKHEPEVNANKKKMKTDQSLSDTKHLSDKRLNDLVSADYSWIKAKICAQICMKNDNRSTKSTKFFKCLNGLEKGYLPKTFSTSLLNYCYASSVNGD